MLTLVNASILEIGLLVKNACIYWIQLLRLGISFVFGPDLLEVFTVDYEQLVKDQELVDEYIRSIGGDRDVAPYVMG